MPDTDSEGYYVSVMDRAHGGGPAPAGTRTGLLLGPYPAKADAEHDVPVGRRLAQQVNDRAAWYAYGVTRVAVRDGGRLPPGRLNELAFQDGACLLIKDASLPVPRSVTWPLARPARDAIAQRQSAWRYPVNPEKRNRK